KARGNEIGGENNCVYRWNERGDLRQRSGCERGHGHKSKEQNCFHCQRRPPRREFNDSSASEIWACLLLTSFGANRKDCTTCMPPPSNREPRGILSSVRSSQLTASIRRSAGNAMLDYGGMSARGMPEGE